jgi:hypothetical protein
VNIYQKLAEARKNLRAVKMKKTGKNKFAGYEYFELGDFLVPMLEVFDELGIISIVSFDVGLAFLTIFDVEKPEEKITITSPMSTANLKACHEVQNLGAVQTYLRRYLYIALMEILEHDACDASQGPDSGKKEPPKRKPTPPSNNTSLISADQVTRLCTMLSGRDMDKFNAWLLETYQIDSKKKIPNMLYEEICNTVEKS